ncbi:Immunoglobulin domain [Nesidiocoris tenuis]|uniref:Immunoglobulin domain n=1 Tax=Nesidiocoris tenuis TaxID=355587 RepID=A0ABN7AQP0_9HEMI|nr:Immunoglobulin domain [Nesidiocoris tenuis]
MNDDGMTFPNENGLPPSVKPVNVSGLKDTRVELGKKVRLVCRCRGHPQPALAWYKDGHPVRASNASRIEFRKKRTSLVIPKAKLEDAGRYECRATSVTGQVASAWANVTVTIAPALTTRAPSLSPYVPKKCPIEKYCLNGGTCALYDTVQELVCTCAEGYKGSRCENKDVYNQSNSSPESWESGQPHLDKYEIYRCSIRVIYPGVDYVCWQRWVQCNKKRTRTRFGNSDSHRIDFNSHRDIGISTISAPQFFYYLDSRSALYEISRAQLNAPLTWASFCFYGDYCQL